MIRRGPGLTAGLAAGFLVFAACAAAGIFISGAPAGCAGPGTREIQMIRRVPEDKLPVFEDDLNLEGLKTALCRSISFFEKLPAGREFVFAGKSYRAGRLKQGLERLLSFIKSHPEGSALDEVILRNFTVYEVTVEGEPGGVLYTGYYVPVLNGSRVKTDVFKYPVYSRPGGLVTFRPSDFCSGCPSRQEAGRRSGGALVPYYTRREIEYSGVLEGRAEPIAWVDDRIDLFFLHVQGSGMLSLREGGLVNLHYAASNGRPYKSIGRYLVESGKIPGKNLGMQSIRAYLEEHPEEQEEVFSHNPRYVFFREEPGGAEGCLGLRLTPGRSAAMDQEIYPPGIMAFVQARRPLLDDEGSVSGWKNFSRFVFNQDSGAAIQGRNRVDIFWGSGRYAETAAGRMKEKGSLYILMPN